MGFNKNTWTKDYSGAPGLKTLNKVNLSQHNKPTPRKPNTENK